MSTVVDWERLERELDDVGAARRSRRLARRGRRPLLLALLIAVAAACVVAYVVTGSLRHRPAGGKDPSPRSAVMSPAGGTAAAPGTRAAIYAAVLSGGPLPHPLRRPVWIESSVCYAVPSTPAMAACADAPIPAAVRHQVIAILGANVQFAAVPPLPAGSGDIPVVQFGRLVLRGDTARVGVETWCGAGCGEGETLALRFRDAAWQVAGTVGPRWVS